MRRVKDMKIGCELGFKDAKKSRAVGIDAEVDEMTDNLFNVAAVVRKG